jgi:hypothetical protein
VYFLSISEASFPVKYKSIHRNKNGWITQGIKIFCEHKRILYTYSRDGNYAVIKAFYVIQVTKKQHHFRLIAKSDNKIKTIWNIIKQESGK